MQERRSRCWGSPEPLVCHVCLRIAAGHDQSSFLLKLTRPLLPPAGTRTAGCASRAAAPAFPATSGARRTEGGGTGSSSTRFRLAAAAQARVGLEGLVVRSCAALRAFPPHPAATRSRLAGTRCAGSLPDPPPCPAPLHPQPRGADRRARDALGHPHGLRLLLRGAGCGARVQALRQEAGGQRGCGAGAERGWGAPSSARRACKAATGASSSTTAHPLPTCPPAPSLPTPPACVQPRPAGGARGSGRAARASATLRSSTRTTPGAPGHHAAVCGQQQGRPLVARMRTAAQLAGSRPRRPSASLPAGATAARPRPRQPRASGWAPRARRGASEPRPPAARQAWLRTAGGAARCRAACTACSAGFTCCPLSCKIKRTYGMRRASGQDVEPPAPARKAAQRAVTGGVVCPAIGGLRSIPCLQTRTPTLTTI